jgi:hypothetical protein
MNHVTASLTALLVRELTTFEHEIEMFPTDELAWTTVPGVTNSAGNLALHVCGNLQHYVGRVLGGTGYVRNREHEFGCRAGTRTALVQEIRTTVHMIERVLPGLSESSLSEDYPEPVAGFTLKTERFLLHLSAHLALHLGQAGYLRRIVTGDTRSAGPAALRALVGT